MTTERFSPSPRSLSPSSDRYRCIPFDCRRLIRSFLQLREKREREERREKREERHFSCVCVCVSLCVSMCALSRALSQSPVLVSLVSPHTHTHTLTHTHDCKQDIFLVPARRNLLSPSSFHVCACVCACVYLCVLVCVCLPVYSFPPHASSSHRQPPSPLSKQRIARHGRPPRAAAANTTAASARSRSSTLPRTWSPTQSSSSGTCDPILSLSHPHSHPHSPPFRDTRTACTTASLFFRSPFVPPTLSKPSRQHHRARAHGPALPPPLASSSLPFPCSP